MMPYHMLNKSMLDTCMLLKKDTELNKSMLDTVPLAPCTMQRVSGVFHGLLCAFVLMKSM